MESLETLQQQERSINQKLNRLRDAERRQANVDLVGRTFRSHNNYSCPEKRSDYWWLYGKVTDIDSSGYLKVMMFQTDKYGSITIKFDQHRYNMSDWEPISETKFKEAWQKLQKKIAATKA